MQTWEALQSGELEYDDENWHGQVHEPLTRNFAVTHMKMRSLDNGLKLYYRLISGKDVWGESNSCQMEVDKARKKAQKHLQETWCGLLIDLPSTQGGTTRGVLS